MTATVLLLGIIGDNLACVAGRGGGLVMLRLGSITRIVTVASLFQVEACQVPKALHTGIPFAEMPKIQCYSSVLATRSVDMLGALITERSDRK